MNASSVGAMKPLLVEIGTEELPVGALPGLASALFDGVIDGLAKRGIAFERGEAKPLYTPRRLAVLLPGVAVEQPEQHSEVLGPYVNIALDASGQPTKALQGFAAKAGADWTALARTSDAKGERFVHRATTPGVATASLLPEIVREAVAAMPIPKPMRWGARSEGFARPVHWFVLLLGGDVVDGELFGLRAGRTSRGHRFMPSGDVSIAAPGDYVDALRAAHVLVDPDERRERIAHEIATAAGKVRSEYPNAYARLDVDLVEEVNCLVEWPSAILCGFEREFLAVPQEALVATMEANQKFFPVLDGNGRLTERFIGVANIASKDPAEVRKGYERVIRPRFADARFFFDEDLKQGLASMNEGLKTVTYQAKLGSVADKVARVVALAEAVAVAAGVDAALARRAAELSKADLQSRLVNEFPELQGVAGRYYARAAGEPAEVANAIDEAYQPRFARDDIALSPAGKVLAIAERLDTLAGGFAAGLKPTGNKDPFALRRNALALARSIIESGLALDLDDLLAKARDGVGAIATGKALAAFADVGELREFIVDRLRGYYADKGVPPQHFAAVLAVAGGSLADFDRRIDAIGEFATLPEAEALAAANKRIRNILKKAEGAIPASVDRTLLREPAESALAEAVEAAYGDTDPALAGGDYVAVLGRLARLRPQVDAFFDQVMVNVDDPAVRGNRLALLQRLADRLGSVAAIEHLSA